MNLGFTSKKFNDINKESTLNNKLNYNIAEDTLKLWDGMVTAHKNNFEKLPEGKPVEVILGTNKVLIGGLMCLAEWLYGKPFKLDISSFEDDLYGASPVDYRPNLKKTGTQRVIKAYNVVYDGSIGADVDPYPRYKIGYTKDTLIPFRRIRESVNNFESMLSTYAHPVVYEHPDGTRYIDYYTKYATIDYDVTMDDGTPVPDNPNDNYESDKDCRLIASFGLMITEEEFVEYFRTEKAGGAESAAFNGTLVMAGYEAELTISGQKYNSMIDSYVFARCNHKQISHGVDGYSNLQYKIMHI